MRFNRGMTYEQRELKFSQERERLQEWHSWFAWHPVKAETGEIVWLEFVLRKGTFHPAIPSDVLDSPSYWTWEYTI